ncbi:MAG: ribose 5-phosphate isomerase B [Oscillospiraceae bacterium]|nr:ribose 5-phosphate isomerase B [Oscillospiraceae bacterium]
MAFAQAHGHTTQDTPAQDYPLAAQAACQVVTDGQAQGAVLLCGSGVGISMAANKVRGIRAVCCSEPYSAEMSRRHNDSNALCMGARVVGSELAKAIFAAWLGAEFEGGRHAPRVALIEG